MPYLSLRVHVPNNWVLGFWVIVRFWGKYMIIGHLDPEGLGCRPYHCCEVLLRQCNMMGPRSHVLITEAPTVTVVDLAR